MILDLIDRLRIRYHRKSRADAAEFLRSGLDVAPGGIPDEPDAVFAGSWIILGLVQQPAP